MNPILCHTCCFPPKAFHAITLFPFVFYNGEKLTDSELRHETIHLWQQLALLWVFFYLLYALFWIVNLVRYRDRYRAYREIPFERYAYARESNPHLTPLQMSFGWLVLPSSHPHEDSSRHGKC